MAGAKPEDVVSSPGIAFADQARGKEPKPARKKRKKLKKSRDEESAVLAHAIDGSAQPPPVEPKTGNKDEAAQIRQRLGIKAEDAKSCQTRVGFQFGFSVADCPDTGAGSDAATDVDVQANVATDPIIPDTPSLPEADRVVDEKTEPASTAGDLANKAKTKPVMQADESGFIPRRVYIGGMPFWYTEDEIRQCWNECGEIGDLTMLTFPDTGNFRGIVFITFATQEGFDAALQFDGDELDGKRLVVQRCKAPAPTSREGKPRHDQGRQHDSSIDAHRGKISEAAAQDSAHGTGQKRGRGGPTAARRDASGAPSEDDNGDHDLAAEVDADGAPENGPKKPRKSFDAPPGRVKGYNVLFVGNVPWELSRGAVSELFEDFHPKFVRMFDKPGARNHKGFAHVHFADEAAVDKAMSMNGASVMGRKLKVMYAQPSKNQKNQRSKRPRKSEPRDVIEEGI